MKTPEGQLRDRVADALMGYWLLTWHEDKEINPGVPDISFVMLAPECETGWLELKAVHEAPTFKFKVEPSQHQWIRAHCQRIPVCFLVAVGDNWYIVPGHYHARLIDRMGLQTLEKMAICSVRWPLDKDDLTTLVNVLQVITRRRNGKRDNTT
jgi:hypothetical protein